MKKLTCLLMGLLLAGCGHHDKSATGTSSAAPADSTALKVVNAGFEQAENGQGGIPGWTLVQHAGVEAYKLALDKTEPYAGHFSARITRSKPQVYGTLVQQVKANARDLVGKTVELSAMLRCKDVGPGGFKLMLNGGTANSVIYSPALTGTTGWKRETIRLKVPVTVQDLKIGVTLLDSGTGWIDDVQFRVVDR